MDRRSSQLYSTRLTVGSGEAKHYSVSTITINCSGIRRRNNNFSADITSHEFRFCAMSMHRRLWHISTKIVPESTLYLQDGISPATFLHDFGHNERPVCVIRRIPVDPNEPPSRGREQVNPMFYRPFLCIKVRQHLLKNFVKVSIQREYTGWISLSCPFGTVKPRRRHNSVKAGTARLELLRQGLTSDTRSNRHVRLHSLSR